jgi:hypothetical protein
VCAIASTSFNMRLGLKIALTTKYFKVNIEMWASSLTSPRKHIEISLILNILKW